MIKNFICWVWGHGLVRITHYNKWVSPNHYQTGALYERLPFCRRCGKTVNEGRLAELEAQSERRRRLLEISDERVNRLSAQAEAAEARAASAETELKNVAEWLIKQKRAVVSTAEIIYDWDSRNQLYRRICALVHPGRVSAEKAEARAASAEEKYAQLLACEQANVERNERVTRLWKIAEADAGRLRSALKQVEWVYDASRGPNVECPWCRNLEDDGHAPDCVRQAALYPTTPSGTETSPVEQE